VAIGMACLAPACNSTRGDPNTRVEFFVTEGHAFSWWDRHALRAIAKEAVADVRPLLPALPRELTVRIQSADADQTIADTGETVTGSQPDTVIWLVDTRRPTGAMAVARAQLRAAVFHELHHLVRDAVIERSSMLDRAVTEGLATAFERDYADVSPAWGWYPAEAAAWVDELRHLPSTAPRSDWMSQHPDGRRWIAPRAGTYLADRAQRASHKSSAELVTAPTDEILALARAE
jgi:hypothetical protein